MNKKNLIDTLSIQTASYKQERMQEYIKHRVSKIKGAKMYSDADGNIYVTKGKIDFYPCVVSHMDTVHSIYEKFKIYETNGIMFAFDGKLKKQVGIGGDDKVGVFITLEALERFDNIKVAFFVDEEVGCHGSRAADMKFFDDVGFVLQCDRKGYGDFVNEIYQTKLYGQDFSDAISKTITKYKYEETSGGITDVGQLKDNGLSVACANMSCGYYNPHTAGEYIEVSEVGLTHDMVMELIDTLMGQNFPHTYEKVPYKYTGYGSYRGWDDYYSGGNSIGFQSKSWNVKHNTPKKKKKKKDSSLKGLVASNYYHVPIRNKYVAVSLDKPLLSWNEFEDKICDGLFNKQFDWNDPRRLYQKLFGKNPKAKATIVEIETDAIAQFNEIMNEHYNEYIKQYNKHNGFTCDNCLEQKTNDQYNHQRSFGKHYQICNDCVSAVFSL
jgi:hypothetical protein